MTVRVRAHSEYHHLPDGTLGVVRAWAVHRRGVNGAIISMPDGRFDCVPIELLTLVSDAEQAAPEPATVAVDARAMAELLEQAAEDIQEWGAYASAYFQEKHNLAANVAKYREAARRLLAGGGQ